MTTLRKWLLLDAAYIIVGFLIAVSVSWAISRPIPTVPVMHQTPTELQAAPAAEAPDLTLADLVEILTVYDLKHEPPGHYLEGIYFGWTDRKTRTIHILSTGDQSDAKDTILHEALHVKCYKLMLECSEDQIEARSQAIYRSLYTPAVPSMYVVHPGESK